MLKKIDKNKYRLPSAGSPNGRAFMVLSLLTALVFVLFWFVGYDSPYDYDSSFVAPLFTNVLLTFVALVVVLALALAVWSALRSLTARGRGNRTLNNIPAKKIAYATAGGTVASLLLMLALGSSDVMSVNGETYNDKLWLRIADMFVGTSMLLIVAAIVAIVVFSIYNYRRK